MAPQNSGGGREPGQPDLDLAFGGPGDRILAIGVARMLPQHILGTARDVVLATYQSLDKGLVARIGPQVVIAPLFSDDFDILDLVETLRSYGYKGRLTVLSHPIPDPATVTGEIRRVGTGMTISLIQTAQTGI